MGKISKKFNGEIMGFAKEKTCENCGFKFSELDEISFYFNDDLTELTESEARGLQGYEVLDKVSKSKISGKLEEFYCKECDELVNVYIVCKNDSGLSEEEVSDLINKSSEFEITKVIFEIGRDLLFAHTNIDDEICPKCNNKIYGYFEMDVCPKCEDKHFVEFYHIYE